MTNTTLTAIPALSVGHWTNTEAATGCTVILCPDGAVAGVDVRGSAPGTREIALLDPVNTVQKVNAILLSGGSAFGLAAADGVMRWLEERGHGFDVGVAKVPIVPAAILFDLGIGRADVRPDAAAGYLACQAASRGPVAQGNIGAGTGATVGKMLGFGQATYIEGASHVWINEFIPMMEEWPTEKDANIVIYCASGYRGGIASTVMGLLGYTNVRNLSGGTKAWVAAELPLVQP